MNGQHIPIPIPTASAPSDGEALRVEDFSDMWIQYHPGAVTVGTMQIQGSIDGENFFDIGSAFSGATPGTLEVTPKKLTSLRCRKTVDLNASDARLTLGFFVVSD